MVLHCFQQKSGRQGRSIALHHFVVEATHRLDLAQWKRIGGVGILQVKIVRAPRLCVGVLVPLRCDCEERVRLVIHEVPSHLVGPIREAVWVLVVRGRKENHSRIDCSRADTEEVRGIGDCFTERGRRRVIRARGRDGPIRFSRTGVDDLHFRHRRPR